MGLAACGASEPQGCRVETVADLKLVPGTSIPAVQASLDNQPVLLFIDTGAAVSTVSCSGADRFNLRPGPDARFTNIIGIGGVTFAPIVTVRHLALGRGSVRDIELPVAADIGGSYRGMPVLGLFGADFLSNYDVDLDVPGRHFGLYKPQNCGQDIKPFGPPFFEMPFRLQDGRIVLDLRLNDAPVTAELDTGSSTTVISAGDAARAGATPDLLASDQVAHLRGVDVRGVEARRHVFASLEIGDERMNNFRFAVADLQTPASLLGNDFLRHNHVFISYERRMLFIQPAVVTQDARGAR